VTLFGSHRRNTDRSLKVSISSYRHRSRTVILIDDDVADDDLAAAASTHDDSDCDDYLMIITAERW